MKSRPLSKQQIISELRDEVQVYQDSYREKGRIRNRGALRTIAALKAAIKIVAASK